MGAGVVPSTKATAVFAAASVLAPLEFTFAAVTVIVLLPPSSRILGVSTDRVISAAAEPAHPNAKLTDSNQKPQEYSRTNVIDVILVSVCVRSGLKTEFFRGRTLHGFPPRVGDEVTSVRGNDEFAPHSPAEESRGTNESAFSGVPVAPRTEGGMPSIPGAVGIT